MISKINNELKFLGSLSSIYREIPHIKQYIGILEAGREHDDPEMYLKIQLRRYTLLKYAFEFKDIKHDIRYKEGIEPIYKLLRLILA